MPGQQPGGFSVDPRPAQPVVIVDAGGANNMATYSGVLTDRSGSVASGTGAQTLAAVNSGRRYLFIFNPSTAAAQGIGATESLWFNFTTTAVIGTPSIEIVAGGSFVMESSFISTELISVNATTTGHKWAAKEF